MKSKFIIFIILICLGVPNFSLGYKFDVDKSQIHKLFDIKTGKLQKCIKSHNKMINLLKDLIINHLCRANPLNEKEHGKWLVKLYDSMKVFIKENPGSQSILTAKLLISDVAIRLWAHWSLCKNENRIFFLKETLKNVIKLLEQKPNLANEIDEKSDKEIIAFNFLRGEPDYKAPFVVFYNDIYIFTRCTSGFAKILFFIQKSWYD